MAPRVADDLHWNWGRMVASQLIVCYAHPSSTLATLRNAEGDAARALGNRVSGRVWPERLVPNGALQRRKYVTCQRGIS